MTVNWFKIINRAEFEATGLVSREVQVVLTGIGLRTILVTKGNLFSLTYDGTMLSAGLGDQNPFISGDYAAYEDAAGDVWLGVRVA